MGFPDSFGDDPIAQTWSAQMRDHYQRFYRRLATNGPLSVKVGNGGLSFYKDAQSGPVFVCHFNARPQRKRDDLGFADFRVDVLRPYLNVEQTIETLQAAVSPGVRVKVNKLWCSLHFPLAQADEVADLFVEHILEKVR